MGKLTLREKATVKYSTISLQILRHRRQNVSTQRNSCSGFCFVIQCWQYYRCQLVNGRCNATVSASVIIGYHANVRSLIFPSCRSARVKIIAHWNPAVIIFVLPRQCATSRITASEWSDGCGGGGCSVWLSVYLSVLCNDTAASLHLSSRLAVTQTTNQQ